ncbi:hypothetical protein JXB02_01490 [Candidatus Woesearchaeota archaeon]|nr:hypothetical protein [Candidatus Woesearchaeota archaeon]
MTITTWDYKDAHPLLDHYTRSAMDILRRRFPDPLYAMEQGDVGPRKRITVCDVSLEAEAGQRRKALEMYLYPPGVDIFVYDTLVAAKADWVARKFQEKAPDAVIVMLTGMPEA